ncbi:MAG: choice-of-anchor D domain-containing protein [Chitinophagales bacterium]|nr:choice-of-anchor D domain-containing protein [Chitinophagales bacterium]
MFRILLASIAIILATGTSIWSATISGELKKWHRVMLLFDGANVSESDATNPFTSYRLIVTFTKGAKSYSVHGHYAADGDAAESSATGGDKWRVYFSPDEEGLWSYSVSYRTGSNIAISDVANAGSAVVPLDGETGSFTITATDKAASDFRAKGRLAYVGEHYLQFSETGEYFIKGGTDSPENLLAYWEFDQTIDVSTPAHPPALNATNGLHRYTPHVGDWNAGDPTWQGGKGKGIIGALNYLASRGVNSIYFITYNLDGGDGKDTWMWTSSSERQRYDVSKLDQWEIVFAHADSLGIQLNILTQETENDGSLGGDGNLNETRKLYYKELISRYAHHLAVVWNMGEENTNTNAQRAAFAQYFHGKDPYQSPVTVHTWNDGGLNFYLQILDNPVYLQYFEMTSLQGTATNNNQWAIDIRNYSASKGRKWSVCIDESDPAIHPTLSNLNYHREESLWGNIMGGGAGLEWYFGYQDAYGFGDLQSEDFTMMEPAWDQTKIALDFFHTYLPFHEMEANNSLASATNGFNTPQTFCFQKPGELYVVYVQSGINNVTVSLNIAGTEQHTVQWFNPRTGGTLQNGTVTNITATNGVISLGKNPASDNNDWAVLVKKVQIVVPAPEINIKQGSNNLPSGNTHTFADTEVASNTDVVFTIENTGTAALTVTTPLAASGDYSIVSQPASSVNASSSTTFTVRFTPTATGTRTGAVTIANNDGNESSYGLNFSGIGTAPEINIKQGATIITTGGAHTFADTEVASNTSVVFTIENLGTSTLHVTTPLTASGDYSVISQPASSVSAASSTTFTVRFTPSASGVRTGSATISNNDANESSYLINFSGNGTLPSSTTWTGSVSDDWFDAANWTNGTPDATLDVIVPNVLPNDFPVVQGIVGTIAEGNDFTIHANASITISNLNNVELIIHGNLTNNGQMLGTGSLTFNGPAHALTTPTSFSGTLHVKASSVLNTNGNLTMEDGASLLHGVGTPGGGGTVNGTIKMKRVGNAGGQVYTYWGSPVSGQAVNVLGGSLYYYETNNATSMSVSGLRAGWVGASGNMNPGKGYISQGTTQVLFNGTANDGSYNLPVTKNAATTVAWNLLGNPYPSGLDASAFVTANAGVIYGSLYFWDDDATGGSGWSSNQDYAVWNGAGTISGPNSGTLFTGHIASGQGFFVEKIANGITNVQFTNAMRSEKNNAFFRMAPIERIKISAVGPTGLYNETLIAFMEEATDTADVLYDARKLKGNDLISLYTKMQTRDFAIQAAPLLTSDRSITMGIDAGIAGDYTLNLKSLENLDETIVVILEDTYTGHTQNLRMNPVYTFHSVFGIHQDRFLLHFNEPLKLEIIDETCAGNDGEISIIQNGGKQWNYILKNQNGLIIERKADFNGTNLFDGLPDGMYELTLIDNDGYSVVKTTEVKGKIQVSAGFTETANSVYENELIVFENHSSGATRYEWKFGDGNTSADENPEHLYSQPGNYEVTLLAENDDCAAWRTEYISVLKLEEVTEVDENSDDSGMKIFTQDNVILVSIENASQTTAIIYDMLGKKLASMNLSEGMNKIELNHFSGSYCFIQLNAKESVLTRKLLLAPR